MLKILQARLQQYMNCELPEGQALFTKERETRDQIVNILWIIKKPEISRNIYPCFIDYTKAFDCVNHNQLWKILQEMGIPDHCLLRNLYTGQEGIVRAGHGTTDWFQIRKGVYQGCILSPWFFNIYRMHHMKCWAGWTTSWKVVGEISIISDMQMTPPLWQKVKRN